MRCEEYNELIWEAAETGLISDSLADHLHSCADCKKSYTKLAQAMSDFERMNAVPAPDPRWAVRRRLEKPVRRWKTALVLTPVATCAVVLLLTSVCNRPQPEHSHQVAVRTPIQRKLHVTLPQPQPEARKTPVVSVAHRVGQKPKPPVKHISVVNHNPVHHPVKEPTESGRRELIHDNLSYSEHENSSTGSYERVITAKFAGVTVSKTTVFATTVTPPADPVYIDRPPVLVVTKPRDDEDITGLGREPM